MSNIQVALGNRVRELRLELGYSQETLALKCGLDRTYIPSIEKGERNISITVLEKLAIGLSTSPSDLLKPSL